ncbi:MAG TPA: hypothetical protein VL361_25730 [Candidatus Limnocylindrales bacterium]|nr:hypothetical protein [Candidatus Limnocylindrales bacterium]
MWRKSLLAVVVLLVIGFLALALARPVLNITRQNGTNVLVSWSATNSGFLLQASTNLSSLPNDWSTLTNAQLLNGNFQLIESVASSRFYRLLNDTNAIDVPDASFIDSNGDGIDGDAQRAIFVATPPLGNDSNLGTMAAPVATLEHGVLLAAAQHKNVYVAAGTYTLNSPLQLISGVSLYGQYDGTTNWGRGIQNLTVISGGPTAVLASSITNETHLEGFSIVASSATAPGQSTYGVLVLNSVSNIVIRYNSISSGNGSIGFAGVSVPNELPASGGIPGNAGTCDSGNGSGGSGATSSCSRIGGTGGNGGPEGANNGSPGGTGAGGTPGGAGGQGGNPGGNGQTGANGLPGANGTNGATALTTLILGNSGFVPTIGNSGSSGTGGNGGGGGGGGGGQGCFFCNDGGGNGGGGGGAGGCGGAFGSGGGGGGGSFAVFLYSASAVITDNALITGRGGNGGAGGNGGVGGSGGSGGSGASNCTGEIGAGGNGGPGGNGGAGGSGSGGPGGPSIGICYAKSLVNLGSNSFTIGASGTGGQGGSNSALGAAPLGPTGQSMNVFFQ